MSTPINENTSTPKRGRGRPPKPSALELEPVCLVDDDATEATRRAAFLDGTAKRWTLRQACGAAGIDRDTAMAWLREPAFAHQYALAQGSFLDGVEETLIAMATGRQKAMRASMQALQAFMASNHEAYFRSRAESLLRQSQLLSDALLTILKRHVDDKTLQAIRSDLEAHQAGVEATGNVRGVA